MKARLLAVLLVSSLVLAAAAPLALAQVTVSGDNNNAVQYVDCSQVQAAVGVQYGDQNAAANDNSTAEVANELNITQSQVNACLGEPTTTGDTTTGDTTTGNTAARDTTAGVIASTVPEVDELPETGGPSGIALAAGCALLGVGLIVNRVFR